MSILCAFPQCPNRVSVPKDGPFPALCPEHRERELAPALPQALAPNDALEAGA